MEKSGKFIPKLSSNSPTCKIVLTGVIENVYPLPLSSQNETYVLKHDKTNKITCVSSEDSDQPGNLPSLIRVFAVHRKKPWVPGYQFRAQQDTDQNGRIPG